MIRRTASNKRYSRSRALSLCGESPTLSRARHHPCFVLAQKITCEQNCRCADSGGADAITCGSETRYVRNEGGRGT